MAEIDEIIEQPSESQQRITKLSNTVKQTAEERDAAKVEAAAATAKAQEAERAAAFSDGFVDIIAEIPAAREHKDAIKEKVLGGMSIEDAKFAVLGKAGLLNQPRTEAPQAAFAGGSATTNLPAQGTEKSVNDMTQAERRAALEGAPDLADILNPQKRA